MPFEILYPCTPYIYTKIGNAFVVAGCKVTWRGGGGGGQARQVDEQAGQAAAGK